MVRAKKRPGRKPGKPSRKLADVPCVTNAVQRVDLRRFLPLVPNERRLAVAAAYLGISRLEFYRQAGYDPQTLSMYRRGILDWPKQALYACWAFAALLGLALPELWEIDDEFDPTQAVPLAASDMGDHILAGTRGKRLPFRAKRPHVVTSHTECA
jgi:hypothetical protein